VTTSIDTNGSGPKRYVADAINTASSGDQISVAAGLYRESNWDTASKILTLVLSGQVTIVDFDPGQTDTDGDGIPDWWRIKYFGGSGSTTNSRSCASCDPNSNGVVNLQEYLAGTDPLYSCPTPLPYTANYQTNIICRTLTWEGDCIVGLTNFADVLLIQHGVLSSGDAYLGYETNSSNNSALVTGAGSVWSNSFGLYIGWDGAGNSLVVSNGGQLVSGYWYLGYDVSSSNNSVLVTGSGSVWSNGDFLDIGLSGAGNNLVVSDGGQLVSGYGFLGYGVSSSNNSVLVTSSGSVWSNSYALSIGWDGAGNSLVVSNGGQVVDGYCYVGHETDSSNNSVLVTGSGSVWSNGDSLYIGVWSASNSLVVSDGGQVVSGGALYVGWLSGAGDSLVISSGGQVLSGWGDVGGTEDGETRVLVTDPGSVWRNEGTLTFGESSGGNSLVISNGGKVISNSGTVGSDWELDGSNNIVLVTGTGSVWSNQSDLYIGYRGSGTLLISNGGSVVSSNVFVGAFEGSFPTSLITLNGGSLTATNALGNGLLDVMGGTLTINAGTVTVDTLWLTKGTNCALVMNGGILRAERAAIANGAVLQFALGTNSHPVETEGNFVLGAYLNITDGGGFTNGTYTLFTYGGTLTYDGVMGGTTPNTNFGYAIDTSTTGQVNLMVTTNNSISAVEILSPTNGATVSGLVNVEFSAMAPAGIASASLSVDGHPTWTVTANTGLPLPTYFLSNGVHTITVQVADNGMDEAQGVASSSITLNLQNNINFTWYEAFGDFLPIQASLAYQNADYTIEITDEDLNPIKTLTGSTTDGIIDTTWDGTDNNSEQVASDTPYFLTLSANPTGSSLAPPPPPDTVTAGTFREGSWGTEMTIIAREKMGLVWDSTSIAKAATIAEFIGGGQIYNGVPLVMISGSDWQGLLQDFTVSSPRNTQFYFTGHGNSVQIGQSGLKAIDVELALQNYYYISQRFGVPVASFHFPYKFVFLDACLTGSGDWMRAFGILDNTMDYSTVGRKNRAFMGWKGVQVEWLFLLNTGYTKFATAFWDAWTADDTRPLQFAIQQAFTQASGVDPTKLVTRGYDQLRWSD
jgi:T5SS/PEP-CTERM-associated repeat protein